MVPLLLVPRPLHACLVLVTTVSTVAGVVGYAALWNVRLDLVSLVACFAGACVTSSVGGHVVYAAAVDSGSTPANRTRSALCARGLSALQGFLVLMGVASTMAWAPVGAVQGAWFRVTALYALFGVANVLLVQSALLASLPNNFDEMRRATVKPRPYYHANEAPNTDYESDARRYSKQSRRLSELAPPTYIDRRADVEVRDPRHAHLTPPPTRPHDYKRAYRDRIAYSRDISQISPGNRLYSPPGRVDTRQQSKHISRQTSRQTSRHTRHTDDDVNDYHGWADMPNGELRGRTSDRHVLPNITYNDHYI